MKKFENYPQRIRKLSSHFKSVITGINKSQVFNGSNS